MKISIDRDKCALMGVCESVAPKYFRISDAGSLDVETELSSADDLPDVEDAVDSCPTEALGLVEG